MSVYTLILEVTPVFIWIKKSREGDKYKMMLSKNYIDMDVKTLILILFF